MSSEYSSILLDITEGVASITLNRPTRLNALTRTMRQEIHDALSVVEAPGTARVLLLTGAGRAFSAGQDLEEAAASRQSEDFDAGRALEEDYNPLLLRLRRLPMPVIAAVNGVAAGASANIALGCDIVIATRSATFLQAFARIGLIPDAGGTYLLPRLVGLPRAMGLAMTAEQIDAETAERWGLIWRCVDDDQFSSEVAALARKFAEGPTRTYAAMKEALYASLDSEYSAQLAREVRLQREVAAGADSREGIRAFLEKRKPRFTGD
ncbi:MAG: 2-(1,2-epoxy-1,2-dihydrophenyl)acetyl-CoA isomerase [Betaproteobacteria bacterium]|nr:2-(1,2-epoxy-1,2-dihydrophenyl)acetyl-CoA isomerase [Betaproteobacteria bacterium]